MIIGIDGSRANRKIKTGVEWYAYHLIQELKKITVNDSNHYFLYTDKPLKGDLARLPENWQEKILRWPFRYLWTKIRLSWEMLREKPDVLFIPSHTLPIFFPKKTIITIHDLGYERYPETYSFFARYHLRQGYKFAAKHATKIIVPTEFTKRELISLYNTKPEKIEIVHLGYNDKIFKKVDDEIKINKVLEKYKIKKPYLLFTGRIETKKGIRCLIEAYKLLITNSQWQNLNLVLIGGRGFGYKEIKSEIRKLKNCVHELGHLTREEDRAYLYTSTAGFIFPSLYEGFGIPILEAMACGVPVIASDLEPIREIIGGKYLDREKVGTEISREITAILVPPENPEVLAQKIKEVLENQELRQQLITKGLERVKNFSWQKCAEETLKILKSLYD